jgi:hemolysin III
MAPGFRSGRRRQAPTRHHPCDPGESGERPRTIGGASGQAGKPASRKVRRRHRRQDAGDTRRRVTKGLASTLYHALPSGKAKRALRVVDHSAIFLLIAGTYTPFALGVLRGAWGWTLFGVVWSIAAAGLAMKVFGSRSRPILSTVLYLAMGWVIVVAVDPLLARVPTAGLLWLVAGGLFYTAGVAFFATDSRLQYGHLAWHVFVSAGTACHYFAVLWFGA